MAQEYYSFMLNRFFETLVILLICTTHTLQLAVAFLVANDYETGSEAHNNSTHGELLV